MVHSHPSAVPKNRDSFKESIDVEALFRTVKRLCYAGLDSVSLRREVAARVVPSLEFDAHAFSTCDPDIGLMTHVVADGIPSELASAYLEQLYPEHCAQMTIDMPRQGTPVYSSIEHSEKTRSQFSAAGMHCQVNASFVSGGRLWGTWCLMRAERTRSTDARARALLQRLVPHIARGLQSSALIDRGAVTPPRREREDGAGVLVLDERHRPLVRTRAVSACLEDLADVGLRMPEDLPLSVLALVSRLRRARVDVAATLRVRTRGRSGRWYTMRASFAEPNEHGGRATVIVVQPAAVREIAGLLTQLYDLSAREREVVAAVARGESTKEIAASLGVSGHTVLEHIDRACNKIGVRGRKALIGKLFFDGYAPVLSQDAKQAG